MDVRRILVTGSRMWDDEAAVRAALAPHYAPGAVLVSGACPEGADAIAERIWAGWGGTVERHPADWARHGKGAGFRRNAEMVSTAPDACVALIRDKSPGSSHTADLAVRAGIPVDRHEVASEPVRPARDADEGRPAELTAADRSVMADRYALDAGHAWKAGDVAKAARFVRVAAELDPSRPELWAQRQRQIQDRAARMPLAAQTAARLAAAGVTRDDPAYERLSEHNRLRREASAQAARVADTSPEAA